MKWDAKKALREQQVTTRKWIEISKGLGFGFRTVFWAMQKRDYTKTSNETTGTYKKLVRYAAMILICCLPGSVTVKAEPLKALPSSEVSRIVDAIYLAEGGAKAKYGIKSVPCTTLSTCRKICENTVRNNYRRWQASGMKKPFLVFLRDRYAPLEAHPLNANWLRNVEFFLNRGAK